jgi:hypothetical protein
MCLDRRGTSSQVSPECCEASQGTPQYPTPGEDPRSSFLESDLLHWCPAWRPRKIVSRSPAVALLRLVRSPSMLTPRFPETPIPRSRNIRHMSSAPPEGREHYAQLSHARPLPQMVVMYSKYDRVSPRRMSGNASSSASIFHLAL